MPKPSNVGMQQIQDCKKKRIRNEYPMQMQRQYLSYP